MRVNHQIRVPKVRVINAKGEQIGVLSREEAMRLAKKEGLDLVEVVPNANPPVCKIIDYGKFRYDQTKREKESKKAQHQVKVKELKFRPGTDKHDVEIKTNRARGFLEKGFVVKFTCMFRGREMAHPEFGWKLMEKVVEDLKDISTIQSPMKQMGRNLTVVLAPVASKKKK